MVRGREKSGARGWLSSRDIKVSVDRESRLRNGRNGSRVAGRAPVHGNSCDTPPRETGAGGRRRDTTTTRRARPRETPPVVGVFLVRFELSVSLSLLLSLALPLPEGRVYAE
jgi:hypothetical protein